MLNYKEIRGRLRHGDIKRIANSLDIDQRVVSEVLNKGWHPSVKNAVLDEAIKILEEEYEGESDLAERAANLELSSSAFSVPDRYKKKKNIDQYQDDSSPVWVILIAAVIAILLFFPGVLAGIIAKFKGNKDYTAEPDWQDKMKKKLQDDYLARVR